MEFVERFSDIKNGFRQILADPGWVGKIVLGGCLLINPLLIIMVPFAAGGTGTFAGKVMIVALLVNVLTFWFPLGFTFEVLRRARAGQGAQLPDWGLELLPRYAKEGAIKLLISCSTLILPVLVWTYLAHYIFIRHLGFPVETLGNLLPPIFLFSIPFCAVACCRWLDGAPVLSCAFDYAENFRLFRKAWLDYLIASAFLVGLNAVTMSLTYTIPFGMVFGLCIVDTWFGPIYAESVLAERPTGSTEREPPPLGSFHEQP